jgi:hypothetical protein
METAKKLPCNHLFHFHCLRTWLERQQSCPTCRADIPVHGEARAPPLPPRLQAVLNAQAAARAAQQQQQTNATQETSSSAAQISSSNNQPAQTAASNTDASLPPLSTSQPGSGASYADWVAQMNAYRAQHMQMRNDGLPVNTLSTMTSSNTVTRLATPQTLVPTLVSVSSALNTPIQSVQMPFLEQATLLSNPSSISTVMNICHQQTMLLQQHMEFLQTQLLHVQAAYERQLGVQEMLLQAQSDAKAAANKSAVDQNATGNVSAASIRDVLEYKDMKDNVVKKEE